MQYLSMKKLVISFNHSININWHDCKITFDEKEKYWNIYNEHSVCLFGSEDIKACIEWLYLIYKYDPVSLYGYDDGEESKDWIVQAFFIEKEKHHFNIVHFNSKTVDKMKESLFKFIDEWKVN